MISVPTPSIIDTRREQMFPTLQPFEIERVRRFGEVRSFKVGEPLAKAGEVGHGLSVILAGRVEVTWYDQSGHRSSIVTCGAGKFLGELAQLAGRPALADACAGETVEALTIPPDRLRALLVAEAELGERIMRALILRRVGLLEAGVGGPVIVGRAENGDVLRLQGFLRSNGHPHQRLDPETDPGAKALIERFQVDPGQLPIVLCPGGQLLRNPGETELARCIGLVGPIDPNRIYDVAIIGAGPAEASRPLSMRDRKGSAPLFSTAARSAVRRVPRLGSRTIGISDRHHRHGFDGSRVQPGAEIWGRDGDPRRGDRS
jgi:thioredoxin reductase (NADPH)